MARAAHEKKVGVYNTLPVGDNILRRKNSLSILCSECECDDVDRDEDDEEDGRRVNFSSFLLVLTSLLPSFDLRLIDLP